MTGAIDCERFRLRRLVERLIELDEVEIHDEPVALGDLSRIIEATPKATLFRNAGPDRLEIVGAVAAAGVAWRRRSRSTSAR